jgi:hypothetical protein
LGGGAANLALKRISKPDTSCRGIFLNNTSDYGASVNIEGNIASYIIASSYTEIIEEPIFEEFETITEKLIAYFPLGNSKVWANRTQIFLRQLGAKIQNKKIINKDNIITTVANKIEKFGSFYFAQRYVLSGKVKPNKLTIACRHLHCTSFEIATTFINALEENLNKPNNLVRATTFPKIQEMPTECNNTLFNSVEIVKDESKKMDTLWKELNQIKINNLKSIFQ